MSAFIFLAFALVLVALIGFAIYKKDSVRASFNLYRIGFSIEAKNNPTNKKRPD